MESQKKQKKSSIALIVDPQSDKSLGGVNLLGDPISSDGWISANGQMQSFELVSDRADLWDVWIHQKEVYLRTEKGQRLVRIMTYPAEGESQGFLDMHGDFEFFPAKSKSRISAQRSLAFIQSLLGT
jgi:hypothetical protein